MAELELTVRCKTLPNRVGFTVMAALFPVWALILPTCLGLFSAMLVQSTVPVVIALEMMTFLVALPIVCILLTAYFEDDRLSLSKDSISFPLSFGLPLRLRRSRSWQELTEARIQRAPAGDGRADKVFLAFKNGETVSLKAGWFSKTEMEQLLLSVELWGKNCTRAPALVDFQHGLQNENRGLGNASYTQMWEEELSRRFNATAFVPLEPEQQLMNGRIKIVRQLAFGGLSAIYLAQRDNADMVVIKEAVVPGSADAQTKSKAEQLFNREAQLLVQLHHPNIARVYDHFVEDGRNYLMLEHINGQDLRQFVKQNGPQRQKKVVGWAMEIASILAHLHTQSPPIIHRDLTPDNLVLRNDGTVKLIDFGAANQFVGTATGTLVGKQAYIAPEQLRGKADLQSDLYSFGGTLYFLLTGQDPTPLSAARPQQVIPAVCPELDELVADLTAFDKKQRLSSAEEALVRLQAVAAVLGESDEEPSENDAAALLGGKT